jgi:hypothetical protein
LMENNGMKRNIMKYNNVSLFEFNIIPPLTFNFVHPPFKISKQWNKIFISFRFILFHFTRNIKVCDALCNLI